MRNYPADDMRASDADRDAVVSDLSEHFQAGRLTAGEFEDRTGQALAARTWGELKALLQDLPSTRPGPQAPVATPSAAAPQRRPGHRAPVPVAVLGAVAVAVVTVNAVHGHWGFLWLVFLALFIARRLFYCAGPHGPRD